MTNGLDITRRGLFLGAAGAGALAFGADHPRGAPDEAHTAAGTAASSGDEGASRRPVYHFSVPDNWKNDPQRPVFVDGEYLYYYLYNGDYLQDGTGTEWRLATTRDHVAFQDEGVAVPKNTDANGDCWSGSAVVDEHDTAGFGAGAVIALITQAPEGVQSQFLWYSTNRGRTFLPGGEAPVLPNPGVPDFRDPKVLWDADRERWFLANAEGQSIGFYTSDDLRTWAYEGEFARTDIGLLECPDLFRMTADDDTVHWVLGLSANGRDRGLPATYAYWTGDFDGASFAPDHEDPLWLDHGFDFYGAVTYPHHDDEGREDPTLRRAIGWANSWDYPHETPTVASDGYNGDDMIVRELRLHRGDGEYYLASAPPAALAGYVTATHLLGDVRVDGVLDLEPRSQTYELGCELRWSAGAAPENIGIEVCRQPGGGRHVALGAFLAGPYAYVNRTPTVSPADGESRSAVDTEAGSLSLRVLVDRTSVELFLADGKDVHSHRVFPPAGDDGIRLFASGGAATFGDLVIRELRV